MIFFTSDQHFFDKGIFSFAERPFESTDEMDRTMIKNFLETTSPGDEVYMLGDLVGHLATDDAAPALADVMRELDISSRHCTLLRGNHDHFPDERYFEMGFERVLPNWTTISLGGHDYQITHDPCMVQRPGTFAICGHIHTLYREVWNEERDTLTVNVGVDVRGFAPISLDEIEAIGERYGKRAPASR